MKKIELFIKKYEKKYFNSAKIDKFLTIKLKNLYEITINIKKNNNKILIFGNGGSAAIASHFSVDMTKIGKIRTVNFNESDLLTCFSNDYGYENWVKKCIEFYSDDGDLIILISSSGESKNMINAAKFCNKKKLKLVTFTGFKKSNKLKKYGNLNFWTKSSIYNHIENIHQYWLLLLTDIANLKK
jgi:D-sedoheptulose 7-phosphate isomerase